MEYEDLTKQQYLQRTCTSRATKGNNSIKLFFSDI